jgi:hypothetical protein
MPDVTLGAALHPLGAFRQGGRMDLREESHHQQETHCGRPETGFCVA